MNRSASYWSALLVLLVGMGTPPATAQLPRIRELRMQQVGTTTYFHVGFERPGHLAVTNLQTWSAWQPAASRGLTRLPSLVPQDKVTSSVYARIELPDAERSVEGADKAQRQPVP